MNVDAAMTLLDSLFPRAKWSDGMAAQFRDDCATLRLTDEHAEAVIRQHRRDRNGSTPQFATLLSSLRKAQFESVAGVAPAPRQTPSTFCDQERARRRAVGAEPFERDNDALVCSYHGEVWEHTRRMEAENKLPKGYMDTQRVNLVNQLRNDLHRHAGQDSATATARALEVWNHWVSTVIGPAPMTAAEFADPFGMGAAEIEKARAERKAKREQAAADRVKAEQNPLPEKPGGEGRAVA